MPSEMGVQPLRNQLYHSAVEFAAVAGESGLRVRKYFQQMICARPLDKCPEAGMPVIDDLGNHLVPSFRR